MTKHEFAERHSKIASDLCHLYNAVSRNKLGGVEYSHALFNRTRTCIHGENNVVKVGAFSTLRNVGIYVSGNNNKIVIGERCSLRDVDICIEDSNNELVIGAYTTTSGKTKLCVCEGTKMLIGKDCLFADDILFRTSDSHSILDQNKERINRAQNITIGNHCWICTGVIVLKGTHIGENTVIGAGSVLTGKSYEDNCIIAGNPGRVVKTGINWSVKRV